MAAWSSLQRDVVVLVGERLLAVGDLDYYMSMRLVCHGWRAATVNPRAEPAGPLFRLQQWVMLDEKHPKSGDTLGRLFLNTATGRFVHKELSASLLDYYFITSIGGLIVVASRAAPHAISVYNPFTGSFIAFTAPIPGSVQHTTAYLHQVGRQLPPTLVLEIGVSRDTAFSAQPDAEQFAVVEHSLLDKGRNVWGFAGAGDQHKIVGLMSSVVAVLPDEKDYYYVYPCCYFIGSSSPGEDNLLVVRRQRPAHGVDVFKVDTETMAIQPTTTIGSRALFLGDRCVSVDADKISSINANCIFYHDGHRDGELGGLYVYDLTNQKEEWVSSFFTEEPWVASPDAEFQGSGAIADSIPPSMIQLLINYCTNITWTQLDVERRQAMHW